MIEQSSCPKCGKPMETGFILDLGHGNIRRISSWVAGEPEKSFWLNLKIGDREVLEVRSFRCSGCGYLESYATKP